MFNLQPGMGLGFTGSKQIALGLGDTDLVFDIDVFIKKQEKISVSGTERPILQLNQPLDEKSIYSQLYREDEEIVALVMSMIKLGILK